MTIYGGGISKNELEIRLRRFRDEINRLLAEKQTVIERNVTTELVGTALEAAVTWSSLSGKPSTFTPSPHTHSAGDITGLSLTLDLLDFDGGVADSIYPGLIADGGDAAETAFTGGIVDPGGA